MADLEELQKMSKSKFGPYTPSQPNKIWELYYKLFLKSTMVRHFLSGGITAFTIAYWLFNRDVPGSFSPFLIWFILSVLNNIIGIFYWQQEKKRAEKEIERCNKELQEINSEIDERKAYFEDLKKQLFSNKN